MNTSTETGDVVVTDPNGNQTEYIFYGGVLTSRTLGYGTSSSSVWTYVPDSSTLLNDVVTDPDNNTTTYAYDADGNIISKTNGLGDTWTYAYNSFDEQTCAASPEASSPCSALVRRPQ